MQTITVPPPKRAGFKESGSRPAYNPVKEFGRHHLGPPPMEQPASVKLECAAGSIKVNPTTSLFRLVKTESIVLELDFPKEGNVGQWNAVPGASSDATWSVSVLVGQLDSAVYPTPQPLSIITGPVIKGAIKYALNRYEAQLGWEDGTTPYVQTKEKTGLIKAVCLTDPDIGIANAVARYAFRIPQAYGLVSEIAMQLTLNYVLHPDNASEFWVNATEFRPGATRVARHLTGPDYIVHAHQIAVSATLEYCARIPIY